MTCSCYIILGLVKFCVQISITWGTWPQGDGESGIPQLKKTPRVSELRWFFGFSRAAASQSYIALATCIRCQWPPSMTWYLCSCDTICPYPNWIMACSLLLYWLIYQSFLLLRCNDRKHQAGQERVRGSCTSFLRICSPVMFTSSSGVSCFRRAC